MSGVERGGAFLVVEGDEEDAGYQRRRRGAAGKEEGEEDYSDGDEDHENVVVAEEGYESWVCQSPFMTPKANDDMRTYV